MALFEIENLSFNYPEKEKPAFKDISLRIDRGEFIVLAGRSGSGKSSFLRHLKPSLSPHGSLEGEVRYRSQPIADLDQAADLKIGYVFQNPDNQIVTDKVWHELAFSLENMAMDREKMRLRVGEMASFFGIQHWFHKSTKELSGGQKQILNLASIMVSDPDILILDEPTSQLDPIASRDFLDMLRRINEDLGTTVLISEHRLEDLLVQADRLLVLEEGELIYDGPVRESLARLKDRAIFKSFPSPMQVYHALDGEGRVPISVREARNFMGKYQFDSGYSFEERRRSGELALDLRELFFRYEKRSRDVVKNLNLSIERGEIHSILGGNGTGKSTSLFLMAGVYKPYRGKVRLAKPKDRIVMLNQDPQTLFIEKTVGDEVYNSSEDKDYIEFLLDFMELRQLLDYHPYDLSGGEQQKLGLVKVLLKRPDILLVDEMTKGLDGAFKEKLGAYLRELADGGMTIVMVSHDLEFCARYSDRASLFFDGGVIATEETRRFFSGNSFYTSKINRIMRDYNKEIIKLEDVVEVWKK